MPFNNNLDIHDQAWIPSPRPPFGMDPYGELGCWDALFTLSEIFFPSTSRGSIGPTS